MFSKLIIKLRTLNHYLLVSFITLLISTSQLSSASTNDDIRIVSTDGFVTEILFAFGLQDHLVGVDVTSRLPEGFREIPNIGYHRNLSAEGLLNLKPTMIMGGKHIGPDPVLAALEKATIPVVQLESATTIEILKTNINKIAEAFSQEQKAKTILSTVNTQLALINKQSLAGERIAFLLSMDPSKLRLAGTSTNADAFIKLVGAENVGNFENYRNVSAESLLAMNPSIILVSGKDITTAATDLLNAQPLLAHSTAGKQGNIISFNGSTLISGLSISAIDEAIKLSASLAD